MSMYRGYLADSGAIGLAGSAVPVLYFAPTATNDANIVKVKVMCPGAASAAPASNADIFASIYKVTGTVGNQGTITPAQVSGNALAANTLVCNASSSAGLSGLSTSGNALWVGDIPETSGASWADDDTNTGKEIALLPSTKYALFCGAVVGAGTNMDVRAAVWFAE